MQANDDENVVIEKSPARPHLVAVMLAGAVAISVIMVSVSLWLYHATGAAQWDLSAPKYQSAQSQIQDDTMEPFPSNGDMTQQTIDDFRARYDDETERVTASEAFSPEALSDETLGLPKT